MIYSHTYLYAIQPVLYRTYSFLLSSPIKHKGATDAFACIEGL